MNATNKTDYRFTLFKEENSLKQLVDKLSKQKPDKLNDKLCVVSVIGKSDLCANSCKIELIDEALGKNIFKEKIFQEKLIDEQILNEIEGYYDIKNNIIFLHLISPMDTDQMINVLNKLNRKLKERGFLDVWSDLNLNTTKCILWLFLISHIVVLVTPSIQIDISFLQLFRLIDQLRTRTQNSISCLLKEITDLSKNWINLGRPCSPRVVFVFEAYYELNQHLIDNKRKYELYLEDQLYRFLRKSRIITNICSNALFAVCNQTDFVYISTKQSSIRDSDEFFNELLHFYCGSNKQQPIISSTICDELISLDKIEMKERTFFDFLWQHINTALTKGFDDNVGRHNVMPIFELPKLITFKRALFCLKDFFFKQLGNDNNLKSISSKLAFSLDTDNMFSETRCTKILPVAFSFYREKLPSNYTQETHEQKLDQTLQFFTSQVRGLSARKYIKILEQDCETYWQNGHQVCGVSSLFNNHCMQPIHRTKSTSEHEINDKNQLIIEHNSNVKYISACNCGHRQGNRDDPFTIKQANNDFYYNLGMKCNCNELTSFEFPIFEGSLEIAKPALLNRFMNLDLDDDDEEGEFYSTDESYDDESEDEKEPVTTVILDKNEQSNDKDLVDVDLVDKLQIQLESQPLDEQTPNANLKTQSSSNQNSSVVDSESDSGEFRKDLDLSRSGEKKKDKNVHVNKIKNDGKTKLNSIDIRHTDHETNSSLTSNSSLSTNEEDLRILNRAIKKKSRKDDSTGGKRTEYSKTEYLSGMLNSINFRNSKNLLLCPSFNSWSLVCLGPSSIYGHNVGIQNQPGFITNTNYLLPWDVTVVLENADLPKGWAGKKLPGIKNKKVLQDGTQFTVKIFVGIEYECMKGHRFMCSKSNTVLKAQYGQIKETANQVVTSDMPLFMPCICSCLVKEELAQLMRIHIVTPKAPVFVTLNPRVQMSTPPCPIFYPMNINENKPGEMIKLTQSAYWILRLPFVYQQMINSPITKIYMPSVRTGHFLKDAFGICKFI